MVTVAQAYNIIYWPKSSYHHQLRFNLHTKI